MKYHLARIGAQIGARIADRPIAAATLLLLMLAAPAAFAQIPAAHPPTSSVAGTAAPSKDIRDIRGPKPIESGWPVPLMVLSAIFAACGSYASWRWNKRRHSMSTKLPFQIALDRLELARQLISPERGREFSIQVSSCVRDYIENRFHVLAARRTTHEFLRDLLDSADSPLVANRLALAGFLQSCDLAKFGGWNLSTEDMETMFQSARRFVIESDAPPKPGKLEPESQPIGAGGIYDSLPTT